MAHGTPPASNSAARPAPSAAEIQNWLVDQLARELQISPDRIKVDQPILSYGVDSMQVVLITAGLEDWLGVRFSGTPLEDHPTIESLSRFVAGLKREQEPAAG